VEIWPAIDLRAGRCVRLQQGDYQRETVFGDDPGAMARHWVSEGARRLHVVDLDGARAGRPIQVPSIRRVVESAGVPCQLGGGIRGEAALREMFDLGLQRLVVGTAAVRQPEWFRQMCRKFPGRLVLGIDARAGRVATDAWLSTSELTPLDVARSFAAEPLAGIVYTDIATDGMLSGPNVEAMAQMQAAVDVPVIASGGISSAADVAELAQAGLAGCIIGRALYEGKVSLAEALIAAGDLEDQTAGPLD